MARKVVHRLRCRSSTTYVRSPDPAAGSHVAVPGDHPRARWCSVDLRDGNQP